MQITLEEVAQETRLDPTNSLIQDLEARGVKNPRVVLAFANNDGTGSAKKWVHVFYVSPTDLEMANLNTNTVAQGMKIKAADEEIIRTIYPEGYIGWCGWLNGQQVWIT